MTLMSTQQSLEELASGSLPTFGGVDSLQPSWSRSLHEIEAANKSFLGGNLPQPTASAQVLLGNRTDFGGLVATLESSRNQAPKSTEAFASIEDTRRKHRDGAIERILQKEREQTQRTLEKALERQLEEDWTRERDWWMKELVGSRNLVDASNSLAIRKADRQVEASFQSISGPTHNLITDAYLAPGTGPLEPKMVQDHLRLVRSVTATANIADVLSEFQRISSSDTSGYLIAWQLFSTMIPNLSSPFSGALGSLIHFCKQYKTVMKNRVASANLAGQNVTTAKNYGTGMGGTIAAFVKLDFGANASIWHILYYCLRCGDLVAAKTVLDVTVAAHDNFPEQAVIQNVVSHISQRQGQASCIWEMGTPGIAPTDRDLMVDLYDKTQNLEPKNVFKIGVLALLSGQSLPETSFSTIEDYLFGHLWLALQQEDPTSNIELIGKSIKKYGPDYFHAEDSGGWGYALPLMASQQFKTALSFLAEAGGSAGLLQATHLGLIFAMKGLAVTDLGPNNGSSGCLVTALLVKYASLLEGEANAGPMAALEYLLKIPRKEKARHEIASMIVRQDHLIDQFGGVLTEEGARRNSILDQYLSREEVSAVLAEAAAIFKNKSHDPTNAEKGAKLFMLGNRYGSLLSLLNELISPADDDSQDKRFWCQESQRFQAGYLSRRTLVVESLEREGSLGLITVNQQLTELRKFFEHIRGGRFQEGFHIVSALGLLPFTQIELNEKESRYKNLDQILKDSFPALVCGTIECLFGMHRKMKSESRGFSETVKERLKELQMMARLIYIFSGLTNMPAATKEYIHQKRNHML